MTEFNMDDFEFYKRQEEYYFKRQLLEMDWHPIFHWMSYEEKCKTLKDNPNTPVSQLSDPRGTKI